MTDFINWLLVTPIILFMEGLPTPVLLQIPHAEAQSVVTQNTLEQQDAQVQFTALISLVPVVVAFSFIVFVFYRARREAFFKQKEAELKLSIAEGELKALRAQIDPHFIFNCLNSIHHYMHSHEVARAGDYLIKFSQLIRHVLESSEQRMVALADELEANRIYIQLEQLRMNHSFDYTIECSAAIDPEMIHIPPMLIQPFVENAIWHGISTGGKVELLVDVHNDRHIKCIVKDSSKPEAVKPDIDLSYRVKKTSMGITLMKERFDTLNQLYNAHSSFTMAGREDGVSGRQVTLIIPYED